MNTDEKLIQNWLDIAPEYLNFALRFIRSPKNALAPYCGKGIISRDLTTLLLAGVAISYLLTFILLTAPLDEKVVKQLWGEAGTWFLWISRSNVKLLVIAILLVVIAFTLLVHGFGKLAIIANKCLKIYDGHHWKFIIDSPLWKGEQKIIVEDSLNAAISFASIFVPYITFFVCLWFTFLSKMVTTEKVTLIQSVCILLPLFIYFPLSIAGIHEGMKALDGIAFLLAAIFLMCVLCLLISHFRHPAPEVPEYFLRAYGLTNTSGPTANACKYSI